MSSKVKVKVNESSYGDYEVYKTWKGHNKQIYHLKYGEDSNWVDHIRGTEIMSVTDTGNGVNVKNFGGDNNFGKIKLDYGAVFELYILLSYYFKDQGTTAYSEFEFVKEDKVSLDKVEEALLNLMKDDANFYE